MKTTEQKKILGYSTSLGQNLSAFWETREHFVENN